MLQNSHQETLLHTHTHRIDTQLHSGGSEQQQTDLAVFCLAGFQHPLSTKWLQLYIVASNNSKYLLLVTKEKNNSTRRHLYFHARPCFLLVSIAKCLSSPKKTCSCLEGWICPCDWEAVLPSWRNRNGHQNESFHWEKSFHFAKTSNVASCC